MKTTNILHTIKTIVFTMRQHASGTINSALVKYEHGLHHWFTKWAVLPNWGR